MKVQNIIFFLSVAFIQSFAQLPANFAPVGTRWEYNYFSYGQTQGKYAYESVKDTIYNGAPHRIINLTSKLKCDYINCEFVTSKSTFFLTVRNDSLLSANQVGYKFLFNFKYKVGDSIPIRSSDGSKSVVKRIADTLIDNKLLKFWEISYTCPQRTYRAGRERITKVYELIGADNDGFYEFEEKCTSDPNSKVLCSTQSGNWSYNPLICQYSVGTNELKNPPLSIKAYPNPTSGSLTVDFDVQTTYKEASFSLIDITGREVLNQKINKGQKQMIWQTEQLDQGLYLIILKIDKQIVYQSKVSIQK